MGSLQAPHQEHNPRYQEQEMRPQTYQIYADAARSGSSRRPTETPPPAGLDPRGRTYEGEGRCRPPPLLPPLRAGHRTIGEGGRRLRILHIRPQGPKTRTKHRQRRGGRGETHLRRARGVEGESNCTRRGWRPDTGHRGRAGGRPTEARRRGGREGREGGERSHQQPSF